MSTLQIHGYSATYSYRLQSLPPSLKFHANSTEPLNDHLKWVLRGHRLDVLELLRFPAFKAVMLEMNIKNLPAFTLQHAREYAENAVMRIEVHVEEFLHRHQGTWLTIRGCSRSALALLGLRLRCNSLSPNAMADFDIGQTLLPPRWPEAVHNVLEMLRAWQEERHDVKRLCEVVETLLQMC